MSVAISHVKLRNSHVAASRMQAQREIRLGVNENFICWQRGSEDRRREPIIGRR